MDCLFCKIIEGEIPSKKIYEDELIVIIMDAYPTVDGHVLIIPKKHYDTYLDIPNELIIYIFNKAKELGPKLMNKLRKNKLTLTINYGDSQAIKHFHLHLLPDYKKDIKPMKTVDESYSIIMEGEK